MDSLSIVPAYRGRLSSLNFPAVDGVLLLPEDLFSVEEPREWVYALQTPTCETLLRRNGVLVGALTPIGERRYRDNRAADWIAPTIFLSASALTQNAALLSISYGIISNYLSTLFSHNPKAAVELDYLFESPTELKRFTYKGPVKGLSAAQDIVKRLEREP